MIDLFIEGLTIGACVLCIWYTMQDGEIFEKIGSWLYDVLPYAMHPPAFECNVCMSPWYGSIIYWITPWDHVLWHWPIIILIAMGFNIIANRMLHD